MWYVTVKCGNPPGYHSFYPLWLMWFTLKFSCGHNIWGAIMGLNIRCMIYSLREHITAQWESDIFGPTVSMKTLTWLWWKYTSFLSTMTIDFVLIPESNNFRVLVLHKLSIGIHFDLHFVKFMFCYISLRYLIYTKNLIRPGASLKWKCIKYMVLHFGYDGLVIHNSFLLKDRSLQLTICKITQKDSTT